VRELDVERGRTRREPARRGERLEPCSPVTRVTTTLSLPWRSVTRVSFWPSAWKRTVSVAIATFSSTCTLPE
jgi:hypothetical protein